MSLILQDIMAEGRGRVVVEGSFAPNGSSAVSSASNKGVGWSVARTSAGLFTITFDGEYKYNQLDSFTAFLQLATGDDKYAQGGTYTAPTSTANGTMTVRVWDASGAAETDVAADANNRINFVAIFRKMDVD